MIKPEGYTKSGKPYRPDYANPQWIAGQGVNEPMFSGYKRVVMRGPIGLFWRIHYKLSRLCRVIQEGER